MMVMHFGCVNELVVLLLEYIVVVNVTSPPLEENATNLGFSLSGRAGPIAKREAAMGKLVR
jgi:hypothetical protein